jgi:hypothetical protein
MCGWEAMSLRCQLPTEDLDALVSVTSKDDLSNLLEEYDAASRDRLQPLKIRAFLFPRATPPLSPSTSTPSSRPMSAHVRQQHYRQTITPSPAVRLPRQQHYHRRQHQHHAVHTGIQLQ